MMDLKVRDKSKICPNIRIRRVHCYDINDDRPKWLYSKTTESKRLLEQDSSDPPIDVEKFKKNLRRMTLKQLIDMNWNNMIIVGDLVMCCLKEMPEEIVHETPIEIYIYGRATEEKSDEIMERLYYDEKKEDEEKITIKLKYIGKEVIIKKKKYENIEEVIDERQWGYDGKKVWMGRNAKEEEIWIKNEVINNYIKLKKHKEKMERERQKNIERNEPTLTRLNNMLTMGINKKALKKMLKKVDERIVTETKIGRAYYDDEISYEQKGNMAELRKMRNILEDKLEVKKMKYNRRMKINYYTINGDDKKEESFDYYKLYEVIRGGDKKKAMELIEKKRLSIDVYSEWSRRTPLHMVAEEDDVEMLELLMATVIKKNVEESVLNHKSRKNENVIEIMIRCRSLRCLQWMQDRIGEEEQKEIIKRGWIEGMMGLIGKVRITNEMLMIAGEYGQVKMILFLVKYAKQYWKKGVNIRYRNKKGETVLHIICKNNNGKSEERIDCVRLIRKLEPEMIDIEDYLGYTPLQRSVESGDYLVMQILLEYGAKTKKYNMYGMNVVHIVAMQGTKEMMEVLLRYDEELIEESTRGGETPRRIAQKTKNKEVEEYINFYLTITNK